MTLPELATRIGEMSGTPVRVTQRVIRDLFLHIDRELDTAGEVKLPGIGRLAKRTGADGVERVLFLRRPRADAEAPVDAPGRPE